MRLRFFRYSLALSLFVFFTLRCCAQLTGLEFSSHEVVQDKRTSLDLSPGKTFCFKNSFELSFDLSFVPNLQTYFGYIVRIVEADKQNIDLIYDAQNLKNHFNLVVGEKLSNIAFDISRDKLFSQWTKISVKFDFDHDQIILRSGAQTFISKGINLTKGGSYKILFGANNDKQFQTTDTPPIRLKDIRLLENGAVQYNWPLDEQHGLVAHEILHQDNGAVTNPNWITARHHDWRNVRSVTVNGSASVAFDPAREVLYVVSADSLYRYEVAYQRWSAVHYRSGDLMLNNGNESVFNTVDSTLYNIFPDRHFIAAYNPVKQTWNKKFAPGPLTNYWQFNKFFCKADTSLYIFDGYGQLSYRNEVQRYDPNNGQWRIVHTKGDFFTPRYLAALGATESGDTVYIAGGFGSESGRQILNPQNIYDIMQFTVKDSTFKKIAELKPPAVDFTFANSLVIDSRSQTFYGLVFPQHKYNSHLQLIAGSLKGSNYKLLGSAIPYAFNDIHSFADLFYGPRSKKFVAVTTLRLQNGQTQLNVYTLMGPPYDGAEKYFFASDHHVWLITTLGLLILLIPCGFYIYSRKRAKHAKKLNLNRSSAGGALAVRPAENPVISLASTAEEPQNYKNSIFLFGDMQVFDSEGNDITKHFTPLIRELFLVILLHSIKWGRGLSSEKLNEMLWYDKSEKSARNNRSVNITKLKSLLDKLGGYCTLSKVTGYWMIDVDYNNIYVDYREYLEIIRDKKQQDIEKIKHLTEIVKRGNFLSNIEYEWLDQFKSEISNDVIDSLLHFAHSGNHSGDPELLIEIVNFIFYFDSVNEEAMVIKCRALAALGKHSLARHTFENFSKDYRNLYGEEFKKDFHAVTV